ncbi:redoxin domain-containing protein [Streptomyces spinoverrucosus]|uniref:redoxin domain-containing protein n=1 Tax=Streptomyces spinoverrucosus TaxID=284043 RepID=UPI0018C3D328|nr:redoxin domain-containing protein [Streptomyces spinoverrucosus]MBG0851517.1 redoxin domain-containing protein [Streptomyces spinoverrucosus]
MRARLLFPTLLAAAALSLAGCGTQDNASSSGAAAAASPSASDSSAAGRDGSGSAAVPEALQFTGMTVDGKPFDAATLAGKPTVLWFWAPWCPTCKAQGPETARVAAEFGGKANVIGVAGLDKPQAMKDFVADTKVDTFPNVSDEAGEVWKKFEITQQSVYVILDKDGRTVFTGSLPAGKGLADKLSPLIG